MTKPTKPRKAPAKARKSTKGTGKPSARAGAKSLALPAARPAENRIFVDAKGDVWVATSKGQVSKVEDEALAAQLKYAMEQRQQSTLALTQILIDNCYDIIAGSTTGHDSGP